MVLPGIMGPGVFRAVRGRLLSGLGGFWGSFRGAKACLGELGVFVLTRARLPPAAGLPIAGSRFGRDLRRVQPGDLKFLVFGWKEGVERGFFA